MHCAYRKALAGKGFITMTFFKSSLLKGLYPLFFLLIIASSHVQAELSGGAPVLWKETAPVVFRAPGGEKLRVLAFTDVHYFMLGTAVNPQTTKEMQKMVKKANPDLLIITGDLWHNNPEGKGNAFCQYTAGELAKLGKPWAFAWGNHDQADDYPACHKALSQAANSLYAGTLTDGNYRIRVEDGKGSPRINFIVLNDSRGGMKTEQIDWFNSEALLIRKETPTPPPALLFFHIPLIQYEDIAASGLATGVKYEKVCFEEGTADALPAFARAGFVKAAFCGHDHSNNYWGMMDGISLEYLRATGQATYGGDKVRKGGTIIDIDLLTGKYSTSVIYPDGSTEILQGYVTK